jgi:hypothetical protein
MRAKKWSQGFYTLGNKTCMVRRPDLFGGMPDHTCPVKGQTCPVKQGFSDSESDPKSLNRYNLVVRP